MPATAAHRDAPFWRLYQCSADERKRGSITTMHKVANQPAHSLSRGDRTMRLQQLDDSIDDNGDDSYPLSSQRRHRLPEVLVIVPSPVTASARSWQCGGLRRLA